MRLKRVTEAILLAGLAACNQQQDAQAPVNNTEAPALPAPPATTENNVQPTATPDAKAQATLEEPKGPIDPNSAEAAGQVVQNYLALIEQGEWTKSRSFWSDPNSAKAFERSFRLEADVHGEIGDLGEPEGAAGSIYLAEPVTFYGKTNAGGTYRRTADVILRRVNDVPGSTERQRQWHIERIEWKDAR
jgi:hypothetical protein